MTLNPTMSFGYPPPHYKPPVDYGHHPFYARWPGYAPPYGMPIPAEPLNPTLNPMLSAGDSALVPFDIRHYPRGVISHENYDKSGMQLVKLHSPNPPKRVRVVSKAFPWILEIKQEYPLTCKEFWKNLHFKLQDPITEEDWAHIARDAPLKRDIIKCYEKRVKPENRGPSSPIRRIDYVGPATVFAGLKKDDEYVRSVLMPGTKRVEETWVAKFTRA